MSSINIDLISVLSGDSVSDDNEKKRNLLELDDDSEEGWLTRIIKTNNNDNGNDRDNDNGDRVW